jgi:hypothetical protein
MTAPVDGVERSYDAQGRPLCFVCNLPQAAHEDGVECSFPWRVHAQGLEVEIDRLRAALSEIAQYDGAEWDVEGVCGRAVDALQEPEDGADA